MRRKGGWIKPKPSWKEAIMKTFTPEQFADLLCGAVAAAIDPATAPPSEVLIVRRPKENDGAK